MLIQMISMVMATVLMMVKVMKVTVKKMMVMPEPDSNYVQVQCSFKRSTGSQAAPVCLWRGRG